MQISRHWRMNAQRYRLQGVRYEDGKLRFMAYPVIIKGTEAPVSDSQETQVPRTKKEAEPTS